MGYNRPLNYIQYTHYNITYLYYLYFLKRAVLVQHSQCLSSDAGWTAKIHWALIWKCGEIANWITKLRMNYKCWLKWLFVLVLDSCYLKWLLLYEALEWRIFCRVVSWSVSDRLVAAETLTSMSELLRLNKTHCNTTTTSLSILGKSVFLLVEVGNPPHTFSSSFVQSGLDEAALTAAAGTANGSWLGWSVTNRVWSTTLSCTHLFLDTGHLIGSRYNQQKALKLQLHLSFIWLVKSLSGFKPSYFLTHERFKWYICKAMF